jgi:hypothetical protein
VGAHPCLDADDGRLGRNDLAALLRSRREREKSAPCVVAAVADRGVGVSDAGYKVPRTLTRKRERAATLT